nr:argininosuccinate synthase domain-containing protein [Bartonella bovis]
MFSNGCKSKLCVEVVTFTVDLGKGEELKPACYEAKMLGIKEIYIEDLYEEFVRDFVFPMFRVNAIYENLSFGDISCLLTHLKMSYRNC